MKSSSQKQDRLAEALRANLRRRKTPKSGPANQGDSQPVQSQDPDAAKTE